MGSFAKTLTVSGVVALSMALSGCVIVASEGGDGTRIVNIEQPKPAPDQAIVRRFSADGASVQTSLWSNCEGAGSFEVQLADREHSQDLTIRVRNGVKCDGEMRDLALSWTYEALGLKAGDRITLKNHLVL